MMLNFKVIENSPPTYMEKYEEFVRLYNDERITVEDIRKRLGWTMKVYSDAREQALSEGLIVDRRTENMKKNKGRPRKAKFVPKYYTYKKRVGKFQVSKRYYHNGEYYNVNYYGFYRNERDAQKIVEELKKVNWDKSKLGEIQKRLGIWG